MILLFENGASLIRTPRPQPESPACKLLLADDDPTFRLMLKQYLKQYDYQIHEAENGQQAIALFQQEDIDIVLLDANMPILNGFQACRQIKDLQKDIPILIITASNEHHFIDDAFAAGAADYIQKPIHWQLLLHRLGYLTRVAREAIERQQRELEMRKLSSALDHAGSSVIMTDPEGNIQYVNKAFSNTTGYLAEEIIGKNPKFLQSGEQSATFYKHMWQTLIAEGEWIGDLKNRRKDGSLYTERLHIRALCDETGECINYVGVFSDISELLEMEGQYNQAKKMAAIGTLVSGVAHNFNNMLTGIIGNAYVAKVSCQDLPTKPSASDKISQAVENIETIGLQAGEMIHQLLAFARKGITQKKTLQLNTLVREAAELASLGLAQDIDHHIDICPQNMYAYADSTQIQQVIIHLLNNARDALRTSPNKEIKLSLRYRPSASLDDSFYRRHPTIKKTDYALLRVSDNGEGMSSKQAEHIFDPFFTTKDIGAGAGLGLSMIKGVAEDHGGTIEVKSDLGVGSSFSFWIPLCKQQTSC